MSFFSLLYAMTLDDLIVMSFEKNPSLRSINERILADQERVNISNNFSNPQILILTNTIDNSEPMSQSNFSFKQKLPYFGKRESHQNLAYASQNINKKKLDLAKVELAYRIKMQAYSLWKLEKLYTIICEYETLTKQNINLYESYTSTTDNHHIGIMSAELALSDLRIEKSVLLAKITQAYSSLSYLSATQLSDLKIDLYINEIQGSSFYKKGLAHNPEVEVKEKEVQETQA